MPLKNYNKTTLRLPSWVENAVVYQIFPDRFKRSKKWSLVLILAACLDPGSIPGISTKNTRYGDDWI